MFVQRDEGKGGRHRKLRKKRGEKGMKKRKDCVRGGNSLVTSGKDKGG